MKFVYVQSILISLHWLCVYAQEECQDPKQQPCYQNTIEVPCDDGKVRCKFPQAVPSIPVQTKMNTEVANSILQLIREDSSDVKLFMEVATCPDISESTPYGNEAPVNIPYCLRVPCDTINKNVETSKMECQMNPGCYYDDELGYLRLAYGKDLLPVVPVCHQAIRNAEFLSRAKRIQRRFAWSSYLTNCVFETYQKIIFDPNVKCSMISLLKYFGFHPKMAGWKSINQRHCKIIGGCWLPDSGCFYGVNNSGFTVDSQQLQNNIDIAQYGRQKCQEYNNNTPMDAVNSFHKCLMAGCSLDKSIDEQYFSLIWLVGNTTSPQVHKALMKEVNAGTVAPNNLESFLEKQKKSIKNYITPFAYNIPFNQSGLISSALDKGILNLLGLNQPFTAPADLGSSLNNIEKIVNGSELPQTSSQISTQPTSTTTFQIPEITTTQPTTTQQQTVVDDNQSFIPDWLKFSDDSTSPASSSNNNPNNNIGSFPSPKNNEELELSYDLIESLKHDFHGFGFIGGCGFGFGRPCPPANFHPKPDVITTTHRCPFSTPKLTAPFPELKGSFEGCCDLNACFLKASVDSAYTTSGASWYYTQWTSWSECSLTCGNGIKKRWRNCISQDNTNCKKAVDEVEVCKERECTEWEPWKAWETCSKTCGGGVSRRKRVCGPNIGISVCGNEDMSMERQTTMCATKFCVEKYFSWGDWHGSCDPCGNRRERVRNCISSTDCQPDIETEICEQKCGKWSKFSEYTECKLIQELFGCYSSRYRSCEGKACKGDAEEHISCTCPKKFAFV